MSAAERATEHPLESQPEAVDDAQTSGSHAGRSPEPRAARRRPRDAGDSTAVGSGAGMWLRVYLQDHHAAAAAGVALARRALGERHAVAQQIAGDRATLTSVMRMLGVEPSRGKIAAARLLELGGRLKPNGRLRGRTPLAPLLELEALVVGIRGKRALWVALDEARLDALRQVPLGDLAREAQAQEAAVEELRTAAARRALAARPRPDEA